LQNARELTQQKPRQAIKMAKTETNRIPNQTTEKYKKKQHKTVAKMLLLASVFRFGPNRTKKAVTRHKERDGKNGRTKTNIQQEANFISVSICDKNSDNSRQGSGK